MKIQLSQIKASPKPIRTSWDEEKLNELKWSLMEEGQVEPIGVHENDQVYTIVWGHRRAEAARRAGWSEIEAVVVPQDEVDNLIQAGIENLAGEDMSADDKAEWAYRLTELGLSISEIARRSTVNKKTIEHWLIYRQEKESGIGMHSFSQKGDEGIIKTVVIKQVLGDDMQAKRNIIEKVSQDNLTQLQTRSVAEAYRDAPTPEVKAQVLKTPIVSRDTAADILRRSINRVEVDTGVQVIREQSEWEKEREERREMELWDGAVKAFLDMSKTYSEMLKRGSSLVKYGKYSPEAARFTIRKIDQMIDLLKNYKDELEQVK